MIVLMPGWAGFRSTLLLLAWRLRGRLGDEVIRPDVGTGIGCIRELATHVAPQVEALARAHPGCTIDLIGHSMGGLVASYLLKCLDQGRLVRRVITLGTPHRGSPAASFMQRVAGGFSAALEQMTPCSGLLRELAAAPVPPGGQLVSIAGANDSVVPPLYAQLPRRARQHNRELVGLGHLGLLGSSEVVELIGRLLATRPQHGLARSHFSMAPLLSAAQPRRRQGCALPAAGLPAAALASRRSTSSSASRYRIESGSARVASLN
jgi:pimeloyl-ACP methyl ester carboxylesterase